jgi:hypothetical protein
MSSPIEKITVKVICGSENGTGFFVDANMLISAYHTVMDNGPENPILIYVDGVSLNATIKDKEENLDVVLLELEQSVNVNIFPLETATLREGEEWETFGFPHKANTTGLKFRGNVHQLEFNSRWDYLLNCNTVQAEYDYGGLSGSPIIVSDKVCAMTLIQKADKLGVISVKKLEDFLVANDISVVQPFDNIGVPDGLKKEIANSVPNYNAFDKIDEVVQKPHSWILLHGSPGCGKTTISATYNPYDQNYVVVGRYFLKVPQDTLSSVIRSSKRKFIEWIEELVYRTIGEPLPVQTNWEQKEKNIPGLIDKLSNYFQSNGKVGIIVLDGLDEIFSISSSALYDFICVIPLSLPENLRIVLSCTSKNILPPQVKQIINGDQEILIEPLDLAKCEAYIQQKTYKLKLPFTFIQELARKSEGHPLYLNYLINYVLNEYSTSDDKEQILQWLKEIPTISGNIENYYSSIWDKISQNEIALAVVVTLSQIRGVVIEDDLIQMLEDSYKLSFYTQIRSLLYLLNHSDNKYEIYHSSFKEYTILNIAPTILNSVNDKIVSFCELNTNHQYAIWNYLYHLSKCSTRIRCIEECSQRWADKCALNDVNPELVLVDIRNITSIAIDENQTTEVIRLLLLAQRIEFRYDSVLAENAFEIAEAMIALGRPETAYDYLVRENTVIVTESDSVHFLQLFYDNGYNELANRLYENIHVRLREIMNSEESFSIQIFLINLYTQTQLCNEGKVGLERFQHLLKSLHRFEKTLDEETEPDLFDGIRYIREYAIADNNAFFLRNHNHFVSIEQMSTYSDVSVEKKALKMLALTLLKYNEHNNEFNYIGKNESFESGVKDLVSCINKYNFDYNDEEIYVIILSIIDDCNDFQLLIELINRYSKLTDSLNFRKENRVDAELRDVFHYFNLYMFRGYIDSNNSYPQISNDMYRQRQWENYLKAIIESIAFIRGKLCRFKAEEKNDTSLIYDHLKYTINKIDFSFDQRSHWDRSYFIPESIFPYIYSQLAQLYIDFFPNKIADFIIHLKNREESQLCLYTEGYRKSLFDIISLFVKHRVFRNEVFDLLSILENHIILGVQNRWERTPELIKIVKYYALLDNSEKAMEIFQEMLNTSMGPSWYKEDQLHLINRVTQLGRGQYSKHFQEFASLLDLASGEMTFQRYVRYEKEEFIGSLTKQGLLGDAIEYFKFETLPPHGVVIENANSNPIDKPREGDGYVLGARNIVEANGILKLLEEERNASPLIKWAICEIFMINDDNFRYVNSFAELQVSLLLEIEQKYPLLLESTVERLSELIIIPRLEEDDRVRYLSHFHENATTNLSVKLQGYLLKQNYTWNVIENNIKEQEKKGRKEGDKYSEACEFYENNYKNTAHDVIIKKILAVFEEGSVGVWFNNYSESHSLLREHLKEYLQTDIETLGVFKNAVLNSGHQKWTVASQLLWFLEDNLDATQIETINSITAEHFSLLIRPKSNSVEKYNWICLNEDISSPNEKIIQLIIWLLNHPNEEIREHSRDALIYLTSTVHSYIVVKSIIEESLSDKPIKSCIQCSFLLKEISQTNLNLLKSVIMSGNFVERINQIEHFMIFKNYLDISIELIKANYTDLYESLKQKIPKTKIITGEVILDEDYLYPISYEIDYFNNEIQILNKEFCERLKSKVHEYCHPLLPFDVLKSDKYVKRSFYNDEYYEGRYPELLNHALNHAIMCRIDEKNMNEVYEYLNDDYNV